ncbi:hypothetical protein [Streptomyces sp. NPDC006134]|uniref:hypothetical protein n=1 Tax=Streptomyces sp. NPDC006134 TaxID=3154467 RepID=UPI0033FC5CB8
MDAIVTDVTETKPLERRLDTVLRIGPSDGDDFLLAIEAQSRKDGKKASSRAYYVACLQANSALAHAHSPHIDAILEALGRALHAKDVEASRYFYEFLEISLGGTPAGDRWKEIMSSVVTYFPGRGTLIEKAYLEGEAKGEARGEARGILRVLETRGIPVSDAVRERITSCTDLDRLDDWLGRALTVERAEELFDEDPTG